MEAQVILLAVCAVLFIVSLPLVLRLVPPNRIYGFRTPKTLSSRAIWYRANVFAGYALMIAAAATGLIGSCVPQLSAALAAGVMVAVVLCATAASFIYLKRIA